MSTRTRRRYASTYESYNPSRGFHYILHIGGELQSVSVQEYHAYPTSVLETVSHDCIHSAILYGAEIWWPSAQCHQVKLERTHRFMLRLISNDFSRQSTYNDLVSHANETGSRVWVPICRTVAIRRTILVYKFWNGIRFIPPGCLIPVTERRSRRLRTHDLQICLPSDHSYLHPSVVLWNSLSFEIVHSQLKTFDSYCKSKLFFEHIVDRGL